MLQAGALIVVGLDQKERLVRQRQILNKRLGLELAGSLGMETGDLFTDEDLLAHSEASPQTLDKQQVSFQCGV